MDSTVLVDIFDTKGVEYLLVISFLLAFVGYWRYLGRGVRALRQPRAARAPEPGAAWFRIADGLCYHPGHAWAAIEPDAPDTVRVGIDDFAHKLLGPLDRIELPEPGAELTQGEPGWSVGVDDKRFELLAPVSGKLVEVNPEALAVPDLAARDPYRRGWLARIRVPGLRANLKNLLSGDLARAWLRETEERLRAAMAGELGAVLQDGGEPVAGIAKLISPERWDEVARDHLLSR
jgi:glycine cleavage system H lipoate-binding protein